MSSKQATVERHILCMWLCAIWLKSYKIIEKGVCQCTHLLMKIVDAKQVFLYLLQILISIAMLLFQYKHLSIHGFE